MPATQSSAAACQMSVPTIFAAVSGKTRIMISPKNVPLPTDVSPTTKPPEAPSATAMILSRRESRNGASSDRAPMLMNVLATRPDRADHQGEADHLRERVVSPSPYSFSR